MKGYLLSMALAQITIDSGTYKSHHSTWSWLGAQVQSRWVRCSESQVLCSHMRLGVLFRIHWLFTELSSVGTEVPIFLLVVGVRLFSAPTGHPRVLATWTLLNRTDNSNMHDCFCRPARACLSLTSVSDLIALRTHLRRHSPPKGIAFSLTQPFRDHNYIRKDPFGHVLSHNHRFDIPSYAQVLPTLKFKDVGHCGPS